MAQRKTTGSIFPSDEQVDGMDFEFPQLEDNDVWLYQVELERFIKRSCPDNMNGRYLAMLRTVCAQARRAIPKEEDDG